MNLQRSPIVVMFGGLLASAVLLGVGWRRFQMLSDVDLRWAFGAAPFLAIGFAVWIARRRHTLSAENMFAATLIAGLVASVTIPLAIVRMFNVVADRTPVRSCATHVVSKRTQPSRHRALSVELAPCGPFREAFEVRVQEPIWDAVQTGTPVRFSYREGAIGIPWCGDADVHPTTSAH